MLHAVESPILNYQSVLDLTKSLNTGGKCMMKREISQKLLPWRTKWNPSIIHPWGNALIFRISKGQKAKASRCKSPSPVSEPLPCSRDLLLGSGKSLSFFGLDSYHILPSVPASPTTYPTLSYLVVILRLWSLNFFLTCPGNHHLSWMWFSSMCSLRALRLAGTVPHPTLCSVHFSVFPSRQRGICAVTHC